jgi:DNA-binding transcriptional MerR regulator
MKMRKRQYRIGELAKALNVKKFVIRFWEKELGLKSDRSSGGQRFYEEKDFETFKTVKHLLYDQKFTIAGAKTKLKELKKEPEKTMVIASTKTESLKPDKKLPLQLHEKMFHLKKRLLKLHDLL